RRPRLASDGSLDQPPERRIVVSLLIGGCCAKNSGGFFRAALSDIWLSQMTSLVIALKSDWIFRFARCGRGSAENDSCSTCFLRVLKRSAWLGRRDGSSHGRSDRCRSVVPERRQDHNSTSVCSHRHRFQHATLHHTLRTCCWPAPCTSLTSWKFCSMADRSATLSMIVSAGTRLSVQKKATQSAGQ